MKKFMAVFALLLASALFFSTPTFTVKAATVGDFTVIGGTNYTYSDNVLTITGSDPVTISGTTTTDRIVVDSEDGANITLSGVDVTSADAAAFEIAESTKGLVTVTLSGSNSLQSGTDCAGLQKNGDFSKLEIKGDGSLKAVGSNGGAGIGGGANSNGSYITISGNATVTAQSINANNAPAYGAGIGGGKGESGSYITISGSANVIAYSGGVSNYTPAFGAGIGGGDGGDGSNIMISGNATVSAAGRNIDTSSTGYGAGIGGGQGGNGSMIKIESCNEVNATGRFGAGIGGGGVFQNGIGGSGTDITISGGTVNAKCEGDYAAGIGGAKYGKGSKIYIYDAIVTATAESQGAGIGGGGSDTGKDAENAKDIKIYGTSIVTVSSNTRGAGIGGGLNGGADGIEIYGDAIVRINIAPSDNPNKYAYAGAGIGSGEGGDASKIKIYGNADIVAYGGTTSAGIGGGQSGNGSYITIDDSAVVKAYGNNGGSGIGGGQGGNGSNITISGSADVTADGGLVGAGIGGGSYGGKGSGITISGSATVNATANSGAGIGGGQRGKGGSESKDESITISGDATVVAISNYGAGIGGGSDGSANNINIENCKKVTAQSTNNGAGIGGGSGGEGKDITISGGEVFATGGDGAGIGGGTSGAGTNITINGGRVIAKSTGYGGAGIGGGNSREGSGITIYDAYVEATGSTQGAGIGGGQNWPGIDIHIYTDKDETTVKANALNGAGIGSGMGTDSSINKVTNETIDNNVKISGNANIEAYSKNGTGIGGGQYGSNCSVTIEGGNIKATSDNSVGIGDYSGQPTVTVSGGTITATGKAAGIGVENGMLTAMISGGTVSAKGDSVGIGATNGAAMATISGGTVVAIGDRAGIGDLNQYGKVEIKGNSDSSPIVYANSIKSANHEDSKKVDAEDGYCGILFEGPEAAATEADFKEGIVYGNGKTVDLSERAEAYTLTAGKTLIVLKDVTLKTGNKFILNASTLHLNAGATLDKWYEMETINDGKIQHEDSSVYEWYYTDDYSFVNTTNYEKLYQNDDKEGIVLCDICGKPEPHHPVIDDDWNWNETHHWHLGSCELKDDCAVAPFTSAIKVCSYIVTIDGENRLDYGEHRYNDDPDDVKNGKLYFYCTDCHYEKTIDIPIISLNKVGVDGEENEAPLAGAEFGIYTNAGCTGVPYMTGITAIENGKAVVSFSFITGDTEKYIRRDTTYYIKEIKAPDGYRLSGTVFMAVVDEDGNVTYGNVGANTTTATVPECRNYAEEIASDPAVLIKVDGEGKPLVGAIFGIYSDADCTKLITTAVTAIDTDETSDTYNKAIVIFDTEPNGTYYIKEVKTPDGYKLSDKIFKVIVGADGKVTYGDDGSDELPVCENTAIEPEPDEPTPSEPTPSKPTPSEPTPSEPTPSEPTPGNNDNPNTGVGIGIAGAALLGGSVCAAFGKQRRTKKKNSGKNDTDF